ncbi:MAG: NAD-dependent epimerase/dehydratase family protein [Myxococcota bacterium]
MRRIAVVGGASPLGRRVVERLRAAEDAPLVHAVETRAPAAPSAARAGSPREDFVVPLVPDPRPFGEYLAKEAIDTVVQVDLVADRCGASTRPHDADVIAAMCLGAAIGHPGSRVRSWVVASSSAIYPVGSEAALLRDEHATLPAEPPGLAASIAEAEDYARESAYRMPHLNVAVLRLQQLVGGDASSPLAHLLSSDPVPAPTGFDPAIQLLHVEDAVEAFAHAVRHELAGVYNVASAGLIRFGDALQTLGRASRPVLPIGAEPLEPLLARLGLLFIPAQLAPWLRYGQALDTSKLERTGWRARYDQVACLGAVAAERADR